MRLLLVRHGESTANAEGRLQGHVDYPLSERGRRESALLARRLTGLPIDALYASPLRRAQETAGIIAARLGLEIIERRELMEHDVGALGGLMGQEILERYPAFVQARREGRRDAYLLIEGMEPYEDFNRRALTVLDEIIAAHPEQTVVAVTHGGVMGVCCRRALGLAVDGRNLFTFDNASITTIEVQDGEAEPGRPRFRLVGLNDTCHLDRPSEHKPL